MEIDDDSVLIELNALSHEVHDTGDCTRVHPATAVKACRRRDAQQSRSHRGQHAPDGAAQRHPGNTDHSIAGCLVVPRSVLARAIKEV